MSKKKNGFLSREDLLHNGALPMQSVDVSEWHSGGTANVRGLSGTERAEWSPRLSEDSAKDKANELMAEIVVLCVCDESGISLLKPADVKMVMEKSCVPLTRIFDTVMALSGLALDAVEDQVGNSDSTPN